MDPPRLDAPGMDPPRFAASVVGDASVVGARSRVSVCVCVCAGAQPPPVAPERDSMWVDGSWGGGGEEVCLGCGG